MGTFAIRVLVVADVGLLRAALTAVLAGQPEMVVVGQVAAVADVLGAARDEKPDVIVMDVDPLDASKADALVRELVAELPETALVVLTADRTPSALRRALRAGVRAFLGKDLSPAELLEVIRVARAGHRVVDPVTAKAAFSDAPSPLSKRELEVMRAAATGLSTKEVAARLFLTPGTVRNHISAAIRKVGGRNRWTAIDRCRQAGWLS